MATTERVDEIELVLRRHSMEGPSDSRQRLIGLALELVAAWRRSRDMEAGSAQLVSRVRGDFLKTGVMLREAMQLLELPAVVCCGDRDWHKKYQRLLAAWKEC